MKSMSCSRLSFLPGAGTSAARVPATLSVLAVFGLAGCTTLMRTDAFVGACRERLEQCEARCARLKDVREAQNCRINCERGARSCAERQGEGDDDGFGYDLRTRHNVAELGPPLVQRVDFSRGVAETSAFGVELRGPTRALENVLEIAPGGSLTVDFIPPLGETREATLVVEHAAGGGGLPSFVTIVLGERALVGRYSAPRRGPTGELKAETWDVTAHLAPLVPGAPPAPDAPPAARSLKMVIYNNAEAASTAPYYLRRIELRAYGPKK
ncbi:hypothetical protein L6V77_01960 [Myxococcota bacterium]|nr:hypothetical protein [Myxococcota bacterium]